MNDQARTTSNTEDLKGKRRRAHGITAQHTLGNMLIAALPIPFADAPILVASQGAMIYRIMGEYRLSRTMVTVTGLYSTIGGPLVSSAGIMTAASLLQLLAPGPGTIIGALIKAGVAGSITAALGLAVTSVCEDVYIAVKDGVDEQDIDDLVRQFESEFGGMLREALRDRIKGPDLAFGGEY